MTHTEENQDEHPEEHFVENPDPETPTEESSSLCASATWKKSCCSNFLGFGQWVFLSVILFTLLLGVGVFSFRLKTTFGTSPAPILEEDTSAYRTAPSNHTSGNRTSGFEKARKNQGNREVSLMLESTSSPEKIVTVQKQLSNHAKNIAHLKAQSERLQTTFTSLDQRLFHLSSRVEQNEKTQKKGTPPFPAENLKALKNTVAELQKELRQLKEEFQLPIRKEEQALPDLKILETRSFLARITLVSLKNSLLQGRAYDQELLLLRDLLQTREQGTLTDGTLQEIPILREYARKGIPSLQELQSSLSEKAALLQKPKEETLQQDPPKSDLRTQFWNFLGKFVRVHQTDPSFAKRITHAKKLLESGAHADLRRAILLLQNFRGAEKKILLPLLENLQIRKQALEELELLERVSFLISHRRGSSAHSVAPSRRDKKETPQHTPTSVNLREAQ